MLRNIKRTINKYIPSQQETLLREQYHKLKKSGVYINSMKYVFKIRKKTITKLFSYTPAQLEKNLRKLGIIEGDTVFMHSSFNVLNGFQGGPHQVIDCVLNVIGKSGNLLMVSMAYSGSLYNYLRDCKYFSVRDTVSHMGVITEIFRKKRGVLRSLNPAHPVLAYGPNAEWIVADHEKISYSCGKGSPFEKALKLNAKALFFDNNLGMTFYHYIEDLYREKYQVNLYHEKPFEVMVYDYDENEIIVNVYAFNRSIIRNNGFRKSLIKILKKEMKKNNIIKTSRIGNTKIMLVELKQVVDCAQRVFSGEALRFASQPGTSSANR